MELHAKPFFLLVAHADNRHIAGTGGDFEAFRNLRDAIAVAHPNGRLLALAETPEEFLRQLALCFEDKSLKKRLQQQAVSTARELYSWEKAVDTAIQFYRSLQPIVT